MATEGSQGMVTSVFMEVYRCFHRCNYGGKSKPGLRHAHPPEFADLALAFCKKKVTQLPPHRWGNCAMDLLIDVAFPRSHVYPLSQAETVAMETYVSESLPQGYIQLSISPVSLSFFFVIIEVSIKSR